MVREFAMVVRGGTRNLGRDNEDPLLGNASSGDHHFVVWKFVSADRTEFRITVKDRSGKLLEDLEGSQTRRGK